MGGQSDIVAPRGLNVGGRSPTLPPASSTPGLTRPGHTGTLVYTTGTHRDMGLHDRDTQGHGLTRPGHTGPWVYTTGTHSDMGLHDRDTQGHGLTRPGHTGSPGHWFARPGHTGRKRGFLGIFGDGDFGIFFRIPKNPQKNNFQKQF